MSTTIPETKKQAIRRAALFIGACSAAGVLYPPVFQYGTPEYDPSYSLLNGFLIGFFIGTFITAGEVFIFERRRKAMRFLPYLVFQTLYAVLVIHLSLIVVAYPHYALAHDLGFHGAWDYPAFRSLMFGPEAVRVILYALVIIFFLNLFRRLSRMLGQHAMLNLLTGKYHVPVEEERVFMFLDLKGSTVIAEKLGHKRYHEFLNDFFYDITTPILESKGQIYQYVGDEVVVTWTREDGLTDADCIYCYFRIAATIARFADRYESRYGIIPEFKAGFHYGPVVTGLVGDVKRDVVFHGDTINTASRIRSECTRTRRNLLLSDDLLRHVNLSASLTPERMGRIRLQGKEKEVLLYSLLEAA